MKSQFRTRIALFLVLAFSCFSQQTSALATLPDITGTGAAVALTPNVHTYAHYIQITCPAANSANVHWGDSNVSATRGSLIAPGGGQMAPASGPVYDLSAVYVYITNGDKVEVTFQTY